MKRITIVLIVFLVALAVADCKKKNYPSDIPKWLKEKIDKMEKEARDLPFTKERTCKNGICRSVEEYTDGTSTYYWIIPGEDFEYNIYNYDGKMVCNFSLFYMPCGNSGYNKYFVRKIWREN